MDVGEVVFADPEELALVVVADRASGVLEWVVRRFVIPRVIVCVEYPGHLVVPFEEDVVRTVQRVDVDGLAVGAVGGVQSLLHRLPQIREQHPAEHPIHTVPDASRPGEWQVESALPRVGVVRDEAVVLTVEAVEQYVPHLGQQPLLVIDRLHPDGRVAGRGE